MAALEAGATDHPGNTLSPHLLSALYSFLSLPPLLFPPPLLPSLQTCFVSMLATTFAVFSPLSPSHLRMIGRLKVYFPRFLFFILSFFFFFFFFSVFFYLPLLPD